ncbi:MAG: hypothetical protein IMF14_05920 [Proteobacteria bacterium]|nr:hypothetical protein [Pseudomonadota bacterium]
MTSDKRIASQIEELCGLGCTQVNQLIDDAEKGKEIHVLSDFNQTEVSLIIKELTLIMSVYDEADEDDS